MTILDVENLTGLDRGTIRYYEKEGLFSPQREKNGYRNYSDEDVEVLKRIKLLRALSVPIEDIRALAEGSKNLCDTLDEHIRYLEGRKDSIETSMRVCEEMRADKASFSTLDAGRYWQSYNTVNTQRNYTPKPTVEPVKRVFSPWRRYFARALDFGIYDILWTALVTLVFRTPISTNLGQTILQNLFLMAMMLIIEPILLHFWGTTPGKWLLGLSVTTYYGRKLSYGEAFIRTCSVLASGYGLMIPGYNLWRLRKCYKALDNGEELPWEEESVLELKNEKVWRTCAYIGADVVILTVCAGIMMFAQAPKHRGDITPEEFAENFNDLAVYNKFDLGYRLSIDGSWEEAFLGADGVIEGDMVKYDYGTSERYIPVPAAPADMYFTVEDGLLTGVTITDGGNVDSFTNLYKTRVQIILSAMSFAGAQKEVRIFSNDLADLSEKVSLEEFEDFSFTVGDIKVSCDIEMNGYRYVDGLLISSDSIYTTKPEEITGEQGYSITFSMTKE